MKKTVSHPFRRLFLVWVLLMLLVGTTQAQNAVTGRVIDDKGQPVAGAAVMVKGSSKGTTTNAEGFFSISVPPGTKLIIRSIGYQTEEILPQSEKNLSVSLKAVATELDEVTVSYGKQRQRDVTGSIATLSTAKLQDQPVMQFAQQMEGKVAGVSVMESSGQPGRGVDFRIRGAASFYLNNQPLFVIDGLPITGSINNINPDEIETFTVLKDASATALYGSRAANGVILITTKHARAGDSRVEFNSNYGVQTLPENKVPKPMNARQFATFMNERYQDKMTYEGYTGTIPTEYQNPAQYGAGTDWYKLLTRSAPIQNYDITLQSATEHSSSTAIFGYQEQQGVLINNNTRLFTGRINKDLTTANGKIRMGINIAPSYRLDHNNRLSTDGVNGYFERLFEASPLIAPRNPDGSYIRNVYSSGMVAYINPLAIFNLTNDDYKTTRILANGYFNYEFLKGLQLKINTGVDKGGETRQYYQSGQVTSTVNNPTGTSSSVDNGSYTAEAYLDYKKTFGDHRLEVLGGYSAQKFSSTSNTITGLGFPNDDIPYLGAATSVTGSSSYSSYALVSTIGRINYSYKNRYLLQGAIRNDGSSLFGADTRYGTFPSVSAGWIVSDESFMDRFKNSIGFLKLRGSYGVTGNNTFSGYYSAQSTTSNYYYDYNNTITQGTTIGNLGNGDLQWERNLQLDLGFDLSILRDRITIAYDYYHKNTDHLIMTRPLPTSSGFSSILDNVGSIAMWGHEISVNTVNLNGRLKWTSSLNVSLDRNKITALVSPGYIRRNNTVSSDYYRQQVGHPLGAFYGFVFEGLYKNADDLAKSAKYQATATNPNGVSDIGTIKVRDINGDGVIDDVNDRTFIGNPTPTFTGGITNYLSYKNFDLSISTAFDVGGQILNAAKWAYQTNMDGSRVPLAAALNHWRSIQDPGSGIYPRTKTGTTAIGREVNSQWLESATYLSIKNVALGYTLPLKQNRMFRSLRAYCSAQELFVLTKYTGMNPEISLSGQDPTQGIKVDEESYPIPRTISFGLSASFK